MKCTKTTWEAHGKKLGGCTTIMWNNHRINYLLVLALQVYDSTISWTVNFQLFTSQSTHQSPQPWRVLPWLGWSYLPTAPGLPAGEIGIKTRPQNAGNLKKIMVIFVLSQGTSSFRHNSQISSEELWQGVVLCLVKWHQQNQNGEETKGRSCRVEIFYM